MMMNQTHSDPVIDEIRDIRHTISARFDHDPERLVAYYMELQRQYRERLIPAAPVVEQVGSSAA
jgi:Mg-chelatase subunit ChlI